MNHTRDVIRTERKHVFFHIWVMSLPIDRNNKKGCRVSYKNKSSRFKKNNRMTGFSPVRSSDLLSISMTYQFSWLRDSSESTRSIEEPFTLSIDNLRGTLSFSWIVSMRKAARSNRNTGKAMISHRWLLLLVVVVSAGARARRKATTVKWQTYTYVRHRSWKDTVMNHLLIRFRRTCDKKREYWEFR